MVIKYLLAGAALCFVPGLAAAQNAGSAAESPYGTWFSVGIAPTIVSDGPFRSDSPTTDSTDVSWTLSTVRNLGRFDIEGEIGATATVDGDGDSEAESAIAGSVEIRLQDPVAGFTPFASYGLEFGRSEFFDADGGTTHTFQAGVRFEAKRAPWKFTFELAPSLIRSSEPLGDYIAVPIEAGLSFNLIPDRVNLSGKASFERRWYQEFDATILDERRDSRFQAFAGVDLAGAMNNLLRKRDTASHRTPDIFDSFAIGLRWVEVRSNRDDKDESDFNIVPAVTIKIRL